MKNYLLFAYQALSSIYKDGAYSSIVLNDLYKYLDNKDKAMLTKSVYGVLEHHEEFSYMLKKLCKKSPRPSVRICLRLGMYYIKYMDCIPDHAAVNEIVELVKGIKKEQAGFVNATLKAYIKQKNDLPNGLEGYSVKLNLPLWLLEEYIKEYGLEETLEIFKNKYKHTHIRLNDTKITDESFKEVCNSRGIKCSATRYGYLIRSTDAISDLIKNGAITVMALDSIVICNVLTDGGIKDDVLDICAAPGGKSVYIAEHYPDIKVYSQDIHDHRVQLIIDYANRMGVDNIITSIGDSSIVNDRWIEKFGYVLLDAPCSGLGVVNGNPDIILNRTPEGLDELNVLQSKLLETAANYVRKGGRLIYSTCSNLKRENEDIINGFLSKHSDYVLEESNVLPENKSYYTFRNDEYGNDGFFVANLRRK